MKKILFAASFFAFTATVSSQNTTDTSVKYAASITAKEIGNHLFTYASDEFEGRNTGEPGQKMAVEYLKNFYVSQGIISPIGGDDYYQEVPAAYMSKLSRRGEIKDSEKFINNLLNEKKIFVAPGTIFGSEGQGYIRFSLCIDESIINEALKRLEE